MKVNKYQFSRSLSIVILCLLVSASVNSQSNNGVFDIRIDTAENVRLGSTVDVPVMLVSTLFDVTAFDFLIQYDPSALSLNSIVSGELISSDSNCAWEYFSYADGGDALCGNNTCPSGKVRISGIKNLSSLSEQESCDSLIELGNLFSIKFKVTFDGTFDCQVVPLRFAWYTCSDNVLKGNAPDSLFISRFVYEPDSSNIADTTGVGFPSLQGANICDSVIINGRTTIRAIDFWNGYVSIACFDTLAFRGDINLDGVSCALDDANLFGNYFVYGLSVFALNTQLQIESTDINQDGLTLSIEDLVLLINGLNDSLYCSEPYDSTSPNTAFFINDKRNVINLKTLDSIGAIFLVFDAQITSLSSFTGMSLWHAFDGSHTRVLISPLPSLNENIILQGKLFSYEGGANLIQVRAATYLGAKVNSVIDISTDINDDFDNLPGEFLLHQNYPNPFNIETTIKFDLPRASEVEFEIINILGQIVYNITNRYSAGSHTIYWDGSSNLGQTVGSGVYYYRITAGDFVSSKKMMLLK